MLRKFFRLLLLVLIFSGCKRDKEEKQPIPLRFEKESLVKKAGENCDTADYDCSIITLDVVRAKGASQISQRINRNLDTHVIQLISSEEEAAISSLEELSEKFLSDYRDAAENFSEEPPWEAYVNENIYLRTDTIVSVGISMEIFSGGAHGYKNLTFLNFDPRTGEKLAYNDIFEPEFSAFVEERFRREQNIPEADNINSTGFWFEDNNFHLPENIGFSEDKVILVYNAYEIAAYAAGEILMEIPIEEVRPFLKNE